MNIVIVSINAGSFLGGAISKYIWIRPELNSSGLKTLAQGGLWGVAIQIAALGISRLAARTVPNPRTPEEEEEYKLKARGRAKLGYIASVIAGVPVSVAIGQLLGIKTTYPEAGITALLSTIGGIFTGLAFARMAPNEH